MMKIYYSLSTLMTEVHVKVTLYMAFSQWVSVCVDPLCWVQNQVFGCA